MKADASVEYLLQKACESHYVRGCAAFGFLLVNQHERERALIFLKDACTKGNFEACGLEGFVYADPRSVLYDRVKAVALLTESCDSGDAFACMHLGILEDRMQLLGGKGGLHLEIACIMGEKLCCESVPAGSALSDLQRLDRLETNRDDLYANFELLDDLEVQQTPNANDDANP